MQTKLLQSIIKPSFVYLIKDEYIIETVVFLSQAVEDVYFWGGIWFQCLNYCKFS